MAPSIEKHSCVLCARRKVKCDRLTPCLNCRKSQSECVYRNPSLSQRHRKRPADEDLLSKLKEYESLMRKNNVKFQPLDNRWVRSTLEEKLVESAGSERSVQRQPSEHETRTQQSDTNKQSGPRCLWNQLPAELRGSLIQQFKASTKNTEIQDKETRTEPSITTPLLIPTLTIGTPKLLELHPGPKHIFKLWQVFAEKVNPLTKVIHAPTLHQRILEVSWNLETVPEPLQAIMFAVYALAITSMRSSSCVETFGETKSVLSNRYRSGAVQALIAAELHTTRDLEVLQAFVLLLLLEPRSELSFTTVAIATRIGHKMGLHRTSTYESIPFFEQEMQLRVWWQIMGIEMHARRKALGLPMLKSDYGDVRMPLNINDADLHPNMTHRPSVSPTGITEMVYCLMKYEIPNYVRSWLTGASEPVKNPYDLITSTGSEVMAMKRKTLSDLEKIYESKYLCHCDPSIPLHRISATVARLTLNRLRFWYLHPRYQPDGGLHMSQTDQDTVFESGVQLLQLNYDIRETDFSEHLLEYQAKCTEVDALVYVLSELRQRVTSEVARSAWRLVERIYNDYTQLLKHDKFSTALADLTLEAWQAWSLEKEKCGATLEVMPDFIQMAQSARNEDNEQAIDVATGGLAISGHFEPILTDGDPLDWLYWDELPQF